MTADTTPKDLKHAGQRTGGLLRRCCPLAFVASALVAAVVLALLCITLGDPGLAWDEPPGIERQHAMHNWFGKLLGRSETRAEGYTPDGREIPCDCRACEAAARSDAKPFDRAGVELGWPFAREAPDEHPPVYAILSYLTWRGTQGLWGPLRAHRLATAVMFAIAAGVMFHLLRRRAGLWAALTAVGALVANPRLFSHAHLATTDVIMASFWFLAATAFLYTTETGRHAWLFGVLAGLALMSKITGGMLVAPLVMWSLLHRRRHAARALLIAVPVILLIMVLVHPRWWPVLSEPFRPVHGIGRWCHALVHHEQQVPVYFLGRVYDYRQTFLPWFNAFFLTATAVPLSLLAAGLFGAAGAVRNLGSTISNLRFEITGGSHRGDSGSAGQSTESRSAVRSPLLCLSTWALFNFLTLVVLRTFTSVPGHDGLRQMVAAFPFFAVLAGYGVHLVAGWGKSQLRSTVGAFLFALTVLPAAYQTARTHPYQLSYYNTVIGGTVGAQRLGMETTYYWDSATRDVIDWLNEKLPPKATLVIAPPPDVRTFDWLQRWGTLRKDIQLVQYDRWWIAGRASDAYLILQIREGHIHSVRGLAGYTRRRAAFEVIPPAVGVRLLAVFEPSQIDR